MGTKNDPTKNDPTKIFFVSDLRENLGWNAAHRAEFKFEIKNKNRQLFINFWPKQNSGQFLKFRKKLGFLKNF